MIVGDFSCCQIQRTLQCVLCELTADLYVQRRFQHAIVHLQCMARGLRGLRHPRLVMSAVVSASSTALEYTIASHLPCKTVRTIKLPSPARLLFCCATLSHVRVELEYPPKVDRLYTICEGFVVCPAHHLYNQGRYWHSSIGTAGTAGSISHNDH